ncbi:hypothetical protein QLQ86_02970 [Halomonas sp. LR5S13]|uniref:hypothetical protein n=1 Tax=Halomonas rhizosphaerae TaxID=3043296 RepID=UPI0024A7B331|nr:hypothetical protein [Halomonas rhizosphaerae]MDI5919754.1 hypothetical protein [Halomonas rhizosphaerae]
MNRFPLLVLTVANGMPGTALTFTYQLVEQDKKKGAGGKQPAQRPMGGGWQDFRRQVATPFAGFPG